MASTIVDILCVSRLCSDIWSVERLWKNLWKTCGTMLKTSYSGFDPNCHWITRSNGIPCVAAWKSFSAIVERIRSGRGVLAE